MGECQQGKFDGDGYTLVQHSHRLPIRVRSENRCIQACSSSE